MSQGTKRRNDDCLDYRKAWAAAGCVAAGLMVGFSAGYTCGAFDTMRTYVY